MATVRTTIMSSAMSGLYQPSGAVSGAMRWPNSASRRAACSVARRTGSLARPRLPVDTAMRSGCQRSCQSVGERRARPQRGSDIGIPRCRAADDIKAPCGVADRPGQHPVDCEAAAVLAESWRSRHPSAGRLETHEAAGRCRNTDRAAAIVPVRHRHDACRHSGRRSAAGPARRAGQVPRVRRGAVGGWFGRDGGCRTRACWCARPRSSPHRAAAGTDGCRACRANPDRRGIAPQRDGIRPPVRSRGP